MGVPTLESVEELIAAAQTLLNQGARRILVSRGEKKVQYFLYVDT